MQLVLMRHGIAEDLEPDEERPLTPKGEMRVRQVAEAMARFRIMPNIVLTSYRLRAIQTAEAVIETLDLNLKPVRIPEIDLSVRWDDFARAVNAHASELGSDCCILCVGHQTQLGCMATMAMHGREFGMEVPKAGVMVFSFEEEVVAGNGRLDLALTPRTARTLFNKK
jgi:phosphohistidine phosphatase SixA